MHRFIIMDLHEGSLFDYFNGNIEGVRMDITKAMWQTLNGLSYLHEKRILHGCLSLKKVLLWKKSPLVLKIGGYAPCRNFSQVYYVKYQS